MSKRSKRIGFKLTVKNSIYAVKRTWRFSKMVALVLIVSAALQALIPLLQAYLGGQLLLELSNVASGNPDRERLILMLIIIATAQLVSLMVTHVESYYMQVKSEEMQINLKQSLLQKQAHIRLEDLELPETQDKYEYATKGVHEIYWYMRSLMGIVSALIGIIGTLLILLNIAPWACLVLAILPLGSSYLRYINHLAFRRSWDENRASRVRSSMIENVFSREQGVLEIRLYGLTAKLLRLWRSESQKAVEVSKQNETRSFKLISSGALIETFIGVLIDIWLVSRLLAGAIALASFEQTRRLVNGYILSLDRISSSLSELAVYGYSVNDYRTYIEQDSTPIQSKRNADNHGVVPQSISLKDLSFTYPNANKPAISGISLDFESGKSLAVVGENGAGKTTLVKAMLGAYDSTSGDILINGKDIDDFGRDVLYENMSSLLQSFEHYDYLTLAEAVAISSESADYDLIHEVIDQVGMTKFIDGLDNGVDSNVGYVEEDGVKLSGGQWQRMAIARALYKKAQILVLDEPTSAIDAKSEQDIMDYIFELYASRMLLIISHRLSTVKKADHIIVLKDGKVAEQGTHKQLFKKGTAYHDLFKGQS